MNDRDIMNVVLQRANALERKKQMRTLKIAATITACCSVLVVVGLSVAMSMWMANATFITGESGSVVGSLLVNNQIVGYVIVGLVSFIIGMGLTIGYYQWYKKMMATQKY